MSISSSFICLNIEKWYASSVGLNDRQAWQDWALNGQYPENSETIFTNIPAMMRRRMSELSKHAVHSALELLSQTSVDYMVFSSRHGELHRSIALVKDILLGEEASPMAFSQSVHNTAAGLATIASKKSIPLTSIAAGENTFHSALIETFCYLQQHPDKKVLLVDFDEPLPEDYAEFEEQSYRGYALALVISQGEQFTISQAAPSVDPVTPRPQALQFLQHYLASSVRTWPVSTRRHTWIWQQR
ncbi:3-oxoacyl-ACP synthase [Vibrio navarrensis]|uniref:Beta-ketoacyl synthase chain length factor n=1 Tax=Vibrio navarrensis TaxID=29495 RepID=A0AAJ4ICQ8_9VIBR|nr:MULTISPECIES: beta-ketoacyl synthase chain length factor [Vibrio]KJR28408.1 3-oxoacyl-ACP synthase [Vibrio sp. S234-5]MBE3652762.1 3-oxoacyl-ACP synthase [Vibrio navarrensis]MBE3656807.1 3-oxoacyl-ACP synthase [Vibrio navarrensis]MBE3660699.1 3-oxoacyl-ACP synthase [Vibrio navarrensis]MBE4603679.1 3-oxoacyl-ACP synthase [Vibrio navarrensis]